MDKQFDMWMAQWDRVMAAEEKEGAKKPKKARVEPSYFLNQPSDDYSPQDPSQEDIDGWLEIYNKTLENQDGLINEAADDDDEEDAGFGPLVRGNKQMTKGDITYFNQPQHFSSIGPDAAPYDGPNRVTPSMTNKALEGLSDMKEKLEVMERRVHRADVTGKKSKRDQLKKELAALRKEVHKLSELIQSRPDKDVT